MENVETQKEQWSSFVSEIAEKFCNGEIITHEYLKGKIGFEKLSIFNFQNTEDFIEAIQNQQFAYMSTVENLRDDLLEYHNMYLKNDRGIGYTILSPNEQVQYGYDKLQRDIKDVFRKANAIMTYVQPVDRERQAKDNDLRAKAALMKSLLKNIDNK